MTNPASQRPIQGLLPPAVVRLLGATVLGAALWSGCATVPRPAGSPAENELRAGMERYRDLVVAMDHAGIAALFTPDGEIAVRGQPPITGRDAILKHLERFKDYRVESEEITTESADVHGAFGHVTGHYRERVRLPSGRKEEARGAYAADWHREPDGKWYIRFLTTIPQR